MPANSKLGSLFLLCFSVFIVKCGVSAYTAVPRWGQAAVLISSDLYIYGGKTDKYNAYSYTSAQNNNDLLYLSLLSSFDSASPPWQLLASSTNTTTSQGPALSWHTLSAFNTSEILLFGGQPGPSSPTVIVDAADSALLLNVFNRLRPVWIPEATGWALEPPRRIHHTTISTSSGLIFIIGGEKADGSGNALADHYVFDVDIPSFYRIPNENGPPDITGHGSVILPDGRLLVFGGYCQSQSRLLPFSTIWVLDTTRSFVWTTLLVSNSLLPSPRRAFVAVLLADGRVLIHGGSDASLQTNFPDGWTLDLSQSPAVWTQVDALTQVGARRDHFAAVSGDQVIFGFGYENSGPASAPLIVYDVPSSTFNPTFTPPSLPPTTMTIPGPSQTQGSGPPTGGHTSDGVHPTTTIGPNPNQGDPNGGKDKNSTAAIAVGTVFGILGLIAIGIAGVYYVKRRRVAQEEGRFITLNQDDNDSNSRLGAGIPVAGPIEEKNPHHSWSFGVLNSIGLASVVAAATGGRRMTREQQRRDMLADEDTREFGEWYDARRRGGTDDTWSLRSILGTRMRSREPSTISTRPNTPWGEKTDPFSDGTALMQDGESAYTRSGAKSRPQSRREFSHSSTISRMSYSDPFSDPTQESLAPHGVTMWHPETAHANTALPPPALRTTLPFATDAHTLSPLSEHTSHNDPPSSVSSHANSNEQVLSPFESMSRATSRTSFDSPHLPGSLGSSIIGASAALNQPLRRSDSWWNRFSRTSFLDRNSSDASRRSGGMLDIRDPNPPPRLIPIEESTHSGSPEGDSPKSHRANSITRGQALLKQPGGSKVYGAHGKSMSSIQTADSEAIERMAGTMDVIQRAVTTRSHRTSGSASTHLSIDTHPDIDGLYDTHAKHDIVVVTSPMDMTHPDVVNQVKSPPMEPLLQEIPVKTPPYTHTRPVLTDEQRSRPPKSDTVVAARIQAYERRLSLSQETPSPTNTKQREERSKRPNQIQYGLAPKPSLYVANPDRDKNASGDS